MIKDKKEYMRAYSKKRYQDMKAKGVCANCEKRPAVSGKTCCFECLNLKRMSISTQGINGPYKEIYFELFTKQGGNCKICFDKLLRPMLDHCHKTGEIRGLLCGGCNSGLGYFKDDTKRLASAIEYLNAPRIGYKYKKPRRRLTEIDIHVPEVAKEKQIITPSGYIVLD